jgi:hypothetical protein
VGWWTKNRKLREMRELAEAQAALFRIGADDEEWSYRATFHTGPKAVNH